MLKYLCFLFCVMFVILSQTGENQFILCELMKWGEGAVFCVLYGANTPFRKNKNFKNRKISKNQVFVIYVRVCVKVEKSGIFPYV